MDAVQLFLAADKPANVWMCGKCRRLHGTNMDRDPQAAANHCCMPYICNGGCGKLLPHEKYRTRCDECCSKDRQEKEARAFEKAKKLTPQEWDGPVFDRHDNFFMSLDDFFDRCHDDEDYRKYGTYVWCAREIKFSPNVEHMIESALDNHHEDAGDLISTEATKELEDFVEQWAAKQGVLSYEPDGKNVVVIEATDCPHDEVSEDQLTCLDCGITMPIHVVENGDADLSQTVHGSDLGDDGRS